MTALGDRYLARYAAGEITAETLLACVGRGWITQAEYDEATAPQQEPTP